MNPYLISFGFGVVICVSSILGLTKEKRDAKTKSEQANIVPKPEEAEIETGNPADSGDGIDNSGSAGGVDSGAAE